jgi:benzoate membrane transport protein
MNNEKPALNLSTISAGLISAIIGYSTSSILVFQAALKLGLPPQVASSWLAVICVAMGLLSAYFSFKTKIPIMFAWSTAGAALLISSFQTPQNINDTYGSFLISGLLVAIVGFSGLFEKMMNKIPLSLAKAMLSGILIKFAFNVFTSVNTAAVLTVVMFLIYLALKKYIPRYSIIILSIIGFVICYSLGMIHLNLLNSELANPVFYHPTFSIQNIFSIAIPLFIVVMTSQNMAGTAVLHAHDYHVNTSKIIGVSGLVYMLIAPFGGFSINLSAITAAICMGPEAHEDKNKRYI